MHFLHFHPHYRLSNMAALDDDSDFPRSAEREGQDDLGSRRLSSNGGKPARRDAAINDPIHDYLRMRMAELQDELRDSGSDGILSDPFSADSLKVSC